jgi:hypothetical protein
VSAWGDACAAHRYTAILYLPAASFGTHLFEVPRGLRGRPTVQRNTLDHEMAIPLQAGTAIRHRPLGLSICLARQRSAWYGGVLSHLQVQRSYMLDEDYLLLGDFEEHLLQHPATPPQSTQCTAPLCTTNVARMGKRMNAHLEGLLELLHLAVDVLVAGLTGDLLRWGGTTTEHTTHGPALRAENLLAYGYSCVRRKAQSGPNVAPPIHWYPRCWLARALSTVTSRLGGGLAHRADDRHDQAVPFAPGGGAEIQCAAGAVRSYHCTQAS